MAVCAIKCNGAGEHVLALVGDKPIPRSVMPRPKRNPEASLQLVARDRNRARIPSRLPGERVERLIGAMHSAQSSVTARTDLASDGGVSIVAWRVGCDSLDGLSRVSWLVGAFALREA